MLHHRPENPVQFVQECLDKVAKEKKPPCWDSFINFQPSDECNTPLKRGKHYYLLVSVMIHPVILL